jgi:hypothetical protein
LNLANLNVEARLRLPHFLLLLALLASTLACNSKAKALRTWDAHERVVAEVVEGRGRIDNQFGVACAFFERVTGLPSHADLMDVGVVPTKRTADDLAAWRAWHQQNSGRLSWDARSSSVEVRPAHVPSREGIRPLE